MILFLFVTAPCAPPEEGQKVLKVDMYVMGKVCIRSAERNYAKSSDASRQVLWKESMPTVSMRTDKDCGKKACEGVECE